MPPTAPPPLPVMAFVVAPEWIDSNGHLNMGYSAVAFDEYGTDPLFEHLDLGHEHIAERGMSVYVLACSSTYLAEMFEAQRGTIDTQFLDADHKRLHFFHTMRNESQISIATSEVLAINVDLATGRSTPFPEDIGRRLRALADTHSALGRPEWIGRPIGIRQPSS